MREMKRDLRQAESQTPFGCWSDQDYGYHAAQSPRCGGCHKRLSAVGPIRTSQFASLGYAHQLASQTPFGCWSDQDSDFDPI